MASKNTLMKKIRLINEENYKILLKDKEILMESCTMILNGMAE